MHLSISPLAAQDIENVVNQMAAAGQAISDAPIFDGICGATVSHGVRGDGTVNHEHLKLLKLRGGSL